MDVARAGRRRARQLPDRGVSRRHQAGGRPEAPDHRRQRFSSPRSAGPTSASTRRSRPIPPCWARRCAARWTRSICSAARSARGRSAGGSGASRFSTAPAAIRERYPEIAVRRRLSPGTTATACGGAASPTRRPRRSTPTAALTVALPTIARQGRRVLATRSRATSEDVSGQHIANRADARRPSGVALRRDVAAADVRRHEDRHDGRRRRRRSGRQSRSRRAGDRVARPRAVGCPRRPPAAAGRAGLTGSGARSPRGSGPCGPAAGETPLPIPLREGGSYILRAIAARRERPADAHRISVLRARARPVVVAQRRATASS